MQRFCLKALIIILGLVAVLPDMYAEGRIPVFLDGTIIGADGRYIVTRNIVSGGAGPVITIAASNVDLDLNGFTLTGAAGITVIDIPPPPPLVPQDLKIYNGTIVGEPSGTSASRKSDTDCATLLSRYLWVTL